MSVCIRVFDGPRGRRGTYTVGELGGSKGGVEVGEYLHLLLAVDFSAEMEHVIGRARRLRDLHRARLSLVHVVEHLPMAYSGDLALPEDFSLEEELLDIATRRMEELGERLGVPSEDRHVVAGTTTKEILRVAETQAVDLILVGSHGRHGLAMLLGSTANSVLHHARCDVLAVRIPEGHGP